MCAFVTHHSALKSDNNLSQCTVKIIPTRSTVHVNSLKYYYTAIFTVSKCEVVKGRQTINNNCVL